MRNYINGRYTYTSARDCKETIRFTEIKMEELINKFRLTNIRRVVH